MQFKGYVLHPEMSDILFLILLVYNVTIVYGGYMLARTLAVYYICSFRTHIVYLVQLITNNLCFVTVLCICQKVITIPYVYHAFCVPVQYLM